MKKWVRRIGIGLLVLFAVAQLKRPAHANPQAVPALAIHARMEVPAEVSSILERSCRDCHSNNTQWPWYSHVAPVSWWLVDHVNHGRSHFNYSEWGKGRPEKVEEHLGEICEEVSSGTMPLPSYLRMHSNARLSPIDVKALCTWTEAEQQRLTKAPAARPR